MLLVLVGGKGEEKAPQKSSTYLQLFKMSPGTFACQGACSEQEPKIRSPPSTPVEGGGQAGALPAAWDTSPQSQRRARESEPSITMVDKVTEAKSTGKKMKLRLLLLCAEKTFIDLPEGGS